MKPEKTLAVKISKHGLKNALFFDVCRKQKMQLEKGINPLNLGYLTPVTYFFLATKSGIHSA